MTDKIPPDPPIELFRTNDGAKITITAEVFADGHFKSTLGSNFDENDNKLISYWMFECIKQIVLLNQKELGNEIANS